MQEVIEPISFNEFCESPEAADLHSRDEILEAFTIRSIGYWLQQNADRTDDPVFKKMEAQYENSAV